MSDPTPVLPYQLPDAGPPIGAWARALRIAKFTLPVHFLLFLALFSSAPNLYDKLDTWERVHRVAVFILSVPLTCLATDLRPQVPSFLHWFIFALNSCCWAVAMAAVAWCWIRIRHTSRQQSTNVALLTFAMSFLVTPIAPLVIWACAEPPIDANVLRFFFVLGGIAFATEAFTFICVTMSPNLRGTAWTLLGMANAIFSTIALIFFVIASAPSNGSGWGK